MFILLLHHDFAVFFRSRHASGFGTQEDDGQQRVDWDEDEEREEAELGPQHDHYQGIGHGQHLGAAVHV